MQFHADDTSQCLESAPPVTAIIGRIEEIKGVALLMEAFSKMSGKKLVLLIPFPNSPHRYVHPGRRSPRGRAYGNYGWSAPPESSSRRQHNIQKD